MADDRDKVELLVDGKLYAGWEQVSINRPMDGAAGTFSLNVTDRWSPDSKPPAIEPGDACEVRLGGETVVKGWVDAVRPAFSATSHGIGVSGRDASADLIDCSAVHKPDEWKNVTVEQLAKTLAAPFKIPVKAEVDTGAPIALVKLQQGETVLEALSRHAKMRRLLVMPDGKGGILITRTGTRKAAVELVQGTNILEADGTLDWSERFSDYIVKGQANYSEQTDGKGEAHVSATAKDKYVDRYRPLIVTADGEATTASAKERAAWEANTRLGQSAQANITVQGWRQTEGGALWEPNMLVNVRSSWLGIDGQMIPRGQFRERRARHRHPPRAGEPAGIRARAARRRAAEEAEEARQGEGRRK